MNILKKGLALVAAAVFVTAMATPAEAQTVIVRQQRGGVIVHHRPLVIHHRYRHHRRYHHPIVVRHPYGTHVRVIVHH